MILEGLLNGIFVIVNYVISLLPSMASLPSWAIDFLNMIGYALNIFPLDVWIITLTNVGLWYFGLIAWAIVEWVYKKIPGVD